MVPPFPQTTNEGKDKRSRRMSTALAPEEQVSKLNTMYAGSCQTALSSCDSALRLRRRRATLLLRYTSCEATLESAEGQS